MAKPVCVRAMTDAEVETIQARARSRTGAARDVERARKVLEDVMGMDLDNAVVRQGQGPCQVAGNVDPGPRLDVDPQEARLHEATTA